MKVISDTRRFRLDYVLVPRLEWLQDFGLVEINKDSSSTFYKLTVVGKKFYKQLPEVLNTKIKDINSKWLKFKVMRTISLIINNKKKLTLWDESSKRERHSHLSILLNEAFNNINTDNAFRLSQFESFIFLVINLLDKYDIIMELSNFENELLTGFEDNKKIFTLITAARKNEGYISIRIK